VRFLSSFSTALPINEISILKIFSLPLFLSQKRGKILQNPVVTTVVFAAGKLAKSISNLRCLNLALNFGIMNNNNELEGENL